MDITDVYIKELGNPDNNVAAVEGGTVNFDEESIYFTVMLHNTGEKSGDATVTLKDSNGNTLETKTQTVDGGQYAAVDLDNSGSGYSLPDGQTNSYTVEVTP